MPCSSVDGGTMTRLLPLTLAVLLASPAIAAEVQLDAFLAGFADGCRQSEDYLAFRRTMVDEALALTRRTEMPDAVRPAVGRAEIVGRDEGEGWISVVVPVTGATFRGLPVTRLELGYASGYPLVDDAVVFAAPAEAVQAAFGPAVEAFARENPESILEYAVTTKDGAPRLSCFATN